MTVLKNAFDAAYQIGNVPISLFGYTITLWQVGLFAAFGGLIMWFIRRLME